MDQETLNEIGFILDKMQDMAVQISQLTKMISQITDYLEVKRK